MNIKHLNAFIALAVGLLSVGCHSKIDLDNIDPQTEVEMGLALPVGTITLTVSDFVGGDLKYLYIDSMDNKGVLTLKIDTSISRNYHQVDLAKYVSSSPVKLNAYEQIQAQGLIGSDGQVTGTGSPVTLDFPLRLKLNGINTAGSLDSMRIDSAFVELASFTSTISQIDLPLEWDWIDKVTLDLGPQISRTSGNTMTVYNKATDSYGYNQTIPTTVDDFSLVLMKNRNPKSLSEYLNNVIDTCDFMVHFTLTIPSGQKVTIPPTAKFNYQLGVQFINYSAIWGWFTPSKDMHDEAFIDLGENWGALDFLTRAKLPFTDPTIDVDIQTQVAGALYIDSAYLFVSDYENHRTFTEFGPYNDTTRRFTFTPWEWLSLDSPIGAVSSNMKVHFDKTPEGGRIHRLFANMPRMLGYRFSVKFDQGQTPQLRITPNTAIKVRALGTLPLMFEDGLYIDYSDTITDVNISKWTLDSLLKEVKVVDSVKTSDVKLFLYAQNYVPVAVKGTMRCLDAAGNIIKDSKGEPLQLFTQDTIKLAAPEFTSDGGWHRSGPGETTIVAYLSKEKLDLFPKINQITFTVILDNESLQEAYKKGMVDIRIKDTDQIKIRIGIAADADAILNFTKEEKNN